MKTQIKNVQSFYDGHSSQYLADRYHGESCEHFSYASRTAIGVEMLSDLGGLTLDVGCGPAIYTEALARMGHKPVCADLSFEMLKTARDVADNVPQAAWTNSELEHLPFKSGCFDNVLAVGVLAYTTDTVSALKELARVIRPGGHLVTQCSNSLAPAPRLVRLKDKALAALGLRPRVEYAFKLAGYSRRAFVSMLRQAGFEPVACRSYDFRLPFLEKAAPRLALKLMRMGHHALSDSLLHCLGEGYMIKAKKMGGKR